MKETKGNSGRGITLVALIITIIVMLILVAVTVTVVVDSDIIGQAEKAGALYKNEYEKQDVGNVIIDGKEYSSIDEYLEKNGHEIKMLEGDDQKYYTLAPSALSFRSSANIKDFQEVQVNGENIDPSNYTITEGSTIIKLSIDYLKTLSEDDYIISIVSKTGSSKAKFTIVEPKVNEHGFYYNQPYTAYVDAFGSDMTFIIREDGTVDATAFSSDTGSTPSVESCSYSVSGNTITITSSMGSFSGTVSPDGMEINFEALSANAVLNNNLVAADEHYVYTHKDDNTYWAEPIDEELVTSAVPTLTNVNGIPVALATYAFNSYYDGNVTLTDATIVCNIGYGSFWRCKNLNSVTIGKDVTSIGRRAFEGCTSLTNITFEGTVEQWNKISKGDFWNFDVPATSVTCSDGTVTL